MEKQKGLTPSEALDFGRIIEITMRGGTKRTVKIHEIPCTSEGFQRYRSSILGNDLIAEVTQYLGEYDPDADLFDYGSRSIMKIKEEGRSVNVDFLEGILNDQNPVLARTMKALEKKLNEVDLMKELSDISEQGSSAVGNLQPKSPEAEHSGS